MKFLSILFFLFATVLQTTHAGVFSSRQEKQRSIALAEGYKSQVLPGKVVLTPSENNGYRDYSSAIPLGIPGEKTTKTIISCAHMISSDPADRNDLFYHDVAGNSYEIIDYMFPYRGIQSIPDACQDVVLYHLREPIPCNSLLQINKDPFIAGKMVSLSFGWDLTLDDQIVSNFDGQTAYALSNTFDCGPAGTYESTLTADRVVSLFNGSNADLSYIAKPDENGGYHQTYYHDSGSPWFSGFSTEQISLTGLSSRFTPVMTDNLEEANDLIESILSVSNFTDFQEISYSLQMMKLKRERFFNITLTSLSQHYDWIYKNIK